MPSYSSVSFSLTRPRIITRHEHEDWRVEINLDDEHEGYDIGERLRSRDLDEEARERLGERVYVSRDGPAVPVRRHRATGQETEVVARELVAADNLSADLL